MLHFSTVVIQNVILNEVGKFEGYILSQCDTIFLYHHLSLILTFVVNSVFILNLRKWEAACEYLSFCFIVGNIVAYLFC